MPKPLEDFRTLRAVFLDHHHSVFQFDIGEDAKRPASGMALRADHADPAEQQPAANRGGVPPCCDPPHGFRRHPGKGPLPFLVGLRAFNIERGAAIVLDFERLDRCPEHLGHAQACIVSPC